jgi:hypothetical protein
MLISSNILSGEPGLYVELPSSITGGARDLLPTQHIQWIPRALSPGSEAAEMLNVSHTKRTKAELEEIGQFEQENGRILSHPQQNSGEVSFGCKKISGMNRRADSDHHCLSETFPEYVRHVQCPTRSLN